MKRKRPFEHLVRRAPTSTARLALLRAPMRPTSHNSAYCNSSGAAFQKSERGLAKTHSTAQSPTVGMASKSPQPMKTSCHCDAIVITVPSKPDEILECQCTICRRYGAAWAYYDPKDVAINVKEDASTREYIWGDRELAFHFCASCGCVMCWKSLEGRPKMGINTRMMEPDHIRTVNRKISFGALRAALKSKDTAHPEDQAQY